MKKQTQIIFYAYWVTFIITVITVIISVSNKDNLQTVNRDFEDFSTVWVAEDGSPAKLSNISGTYPVSTILPEIEEDDVLYFNIKSLNVDVFLEGECIYQTKVHNPRLFGYTAGSDYVRIPLRVEDSGKKLTLELNNPYHDGSGKVTQIRMGNAVDMLLDNVNSRVIGLCISVIITFIGVFFVILFIPMWKHKIVGKEMLYLGLFAFGIGMFMLTDCKVPQEISKNAHIYHTIAELFMMLFIAPMFLFFDAMFKNYKVNSKVMLGVCTFTLVDFVISYVLMITGVMDLHETVRLTHATYVVAIVVLIVLLIQNAIHHREAIRYHVWGILCICGGGLADILILNFGTSMDTTLFTRLGALFFMCCEATQIISNLLVAYQKGIKAQLLEKLAYQDGLTELFNRTSFMEEVAKLQSEPHAKVLVAIFDVNDLKYVNDNLGHALGDEMLTLVANGIREYFSEFGKCYRIGGDEFAFLSTDFDCVIKYKQAYNDFVAHFEKMNATRKFPHKIVVAAGYSTTDTVHPKSLSDAIDTADCRMYLNKKELKAAKIS